MTQALVANGRAHTVAKSQTLRSRGIQDRQARATTADHVIYRYEHLETALAGMWLRAKVAAAHRDPSTDQMFVLTLLSEGSAQDALRASLAHATSLGFNPVVVVVDPDETVSAVLDQTRTDDTLFVVHSDAENTLRWTAIHGPDAAGSRRAPLLMDRDRLRAMPIKDLTQAYSVGPQERRLQSSQLRDVRRQLVRLKGEARV